MSNKKVMSIAIRPELHDELKKFSKRRGMSASAYVGDLVEKAVKLDIDEEPMIIARPLDEEVIPVILKVPKSLIEAGDSEQLKKWVSAQAGGVYKGLLKKMEAKINPE
jgi:hypothetical protein